MTWREYVLQVMAHRRRVRALGRCCLRPWAAGRVLCWWHDIEKWVFLPWLFKYRCGRGDRAAAARVYERLNAVGRVVEWVVLLPYSALQRMGARRFVRVLDCVDRSMDPVARVELGDAVQPPPIERFLQDTIDLECATALRQVWVSLFGREVVRHQWMTNVVTRDAWRRAWDKDPEMARLLASKEYWEGKKYR